MSTALKNLAREVKTTPQTRQARADQVKNNAGGFVFEVSPKDRLERFLILGTDKGSYYASEQKLTQENGDFLRKMIAENERLVVDTTVDVSVNGRAYRQSPALYAIALVLTEGKDKAYAREAFQKVVRTSTHLFEAAEYVDTLGGWGRAKRAAFAEWYDKRPAELGYQMVKYRQRNGWTHKDVLRLSHAQPSEGLAKFALGKNFTAPEVPSIVLGFQSMQASQTVEDVLRNLDDFSELPWETIPTQFLTDARVWKALFYNGQLNGQALVRNVTRLAKIGAFDDVQFAGDVAMRLADAEMISRTRLHPINFLNALSVYRNGRMVGTSGWGYASRQKDWTVNAKVAGGLEAGFYGSFGNIVPANKRFQLAIDTSGSMTWWGPAGLVGMDCREAAAAMAMVTARTEPYVEVIGFGTTQQAIELSDTDSLEAVQNKIDRLSVGGTNLSLPMVNAKREKREFDVFVQYTDNETWAGNIHPFQAMRDYRQASGIDARLAVVGMVSNGFTIADSSDKGMMDFVGFDSSAPSVLSDFSAGRL